MVINLIRKDLVALRMYFLFILGYALFFGVATVTPYSPLLIGVLPAIMMTLFVSSVELRNKSLLFIGSLPVKRQQIVLAKYAAVFVYLAIGFALAGAVRVINETILGQSFPLTAVHLVLAAGVAMAYTALYYPIQFRLGARNSTLVSFLVVFLTMAIVGGLGSTFGKPGLVLPDYSQWLWGIPLAGLILMVVSYGISLRIFGARDIEG